MPVIESAFAEIDLISNMAKLSGRYHCDLSALSELI